MLPYAEALRFYGHEVTSRWIEGNHEGPGITEEMCAVDDLQDVLAAECIISFTEVPASSRNRGGRHVEFGIGIATNQHLILVGPREHVFHHLGRVLQYDTWDDALTNLRPVGVAVSA